MKRVYLFFMLVFVVVLIGCASHQVVQKERGNKVLIVLRESGGSGDEEYFYTREAIMIPQMLEEAGFQPVMASASGRTFEGSVYSSTSFKTLKLADVKVSDYEAFIFPSDNRKDLYRKENAAPEAITIVKQAVAKRKLVAAQRWGVVVLAEAGVLEKRQFAFPVDPQDDVRFANAIKNWNKEELIVQDKNIITTGLCPYANPGIELTKALIAELQK